MKTKSILIAALLSAGLMFTACNKGGEPSPKLKVYPESEVVDQTRGKTPVHQEVANVRTEKENLDKATP